MRITLHDARLGYLVVAEDGRDRFLQFEADFIRLAECFGRRVAGEAASRGEFVCDYLDAHVGMSIEDPGYFD